MKTLLVIMSEGFLGFLCKNIGKFVRVNVAFQRPFFEIAKGIWVRGKITLFRYVNLWGEFGQIFTLNFFFLNFGGEFS